MSTWSPVLFLIIYGNFPVLSQVLHKCLGLDYHLRLEQLNWHMLLKEKKKIVKIRKGNLKCKQTLTKMFLRNFFVKMKLECKQNFHDFFFEKVRQNEVISVLFRNNVNKLSRFF